MKKIIFALVLLILMCSCSQKSIQKPETVFNSATITVSTKDTSISGTASRSGANMWSFTFTAPDNIKGLTVTKKGGGYETSFMGLTRTHADTPLEKDSPIEDIFSLLEYIEQNECEQTNTDKEKTEFVYKTEKRDYKVTADCTTGAISGISCDDYEALFSY